MHIATDAEPSALDNFFWSLIVREFEILIEHGLLPPHPKPFEDTIGHLCSEWGRVIRE